MTAPGTRRGLTVAGAGVVVTGAGSGIGAALAARLAADAADRPGPEWTAGAGVAPVPPRWRRSS